MQVLHHLQDMQNTTSTLTSIKPDLCWKVCAGLLEVQLSVAACFAALPAVHAAEHSAAAIAAAMSPYPAAASGALTNIFFVMYSCVP